MISLPFAVIPTALGTVTTGNERASRPASHLGEFDTVGMVWQTNGAANAWVRGDFGSAKRIDFISMLAAKALPGTTIRVRLGDSQAAVDGTASYDSGVLPFIDPSISRDDGLYHSHLELSAIETRRWWRIDIGGHTGDFEASTLILGEKRTAANYYAPGWTFGAEDLGEIDVGRWGVAEEKPGLIFRTLAFSFGWLTESDFETTFRPIQERLGKRRVSYWCFDPTAGPYRQAKSYLGWLRTPPVATHAADTPAGVRYRQDYEILSMI